MSKWFVQEAFIEWCFTRYQWNGPISLSLIKCNNTNIYMLVFSFAWRFMSICCTLLGNMKIVKCEHLHKKCKTITYKTHMRTKNISCNNGLCEKPLLNHVALGRFDSMFCSFVSAEASCLDSGVTNIIFILLSFAFSMRWSCSIIHATLVSGGTDSCNWWVGRANRCYSLCWVCFEIHSFKNNDYLDLWLIAVRLHLCCLYGRRRHRKLHLFYIDDSVVLRVGNTNEIFLFSWVNGLCKKPL
jgi:hypothetical protein